MSFVTITEAAELVNKSTQTLYRHIKSGKLSRESNGLLQTAELIRVYGELRKNENSQKVSVDTVSQHESVNVINLLQQQIDKLEKDLQDLKTESLERERQGIEREKRLMALLENQTSRDSTGGLFSKLFK
jgi:TolA-binding protein